MVDHCREKIGLARSFGEGTIKFDDKEGVYTVRKGGNGTAYKVRFVNIENANKMPSCECFSWKTTKLPCKHMFAIILNGLERWESFSEDFRTLPYMVLDEVVCPAATTATTIPSSTHKDQQINRPSTEEENLTCDDPKTPFAELPRKVVKHQTTLTNCRGMLKEIRSATFLMLDEQVY